MGLLRRATKKFYYGEWWHAVVLAAMCAVVLKLLRSRGGWLHFATANLKVSIASNATVGSIRTGVVFPNDG